MTERLKIICSHLPRASVFADVGCDHGYCTQYALENGLCERAYISDISAESLKKAEQLLQKYVKAGRCIPVCADGLKGIKEKCGCVLIAGMGGEEMIKIFSESYLPPSFVLQPMKNPEKVRSFLLEQGCRMLYDGTFYAEGKYYDLIAGETGGADEYTDFELLFGRDNLKHPTDAFLQKVRKEQEKLRALLKTPMQESSREELIERLRYYEEITDVFEDDL